MNPPFCNLALKSRPNANSFSDTKLTTFVNIYTYGILRRTPELLEAMDQIHFDGLLMVKLMRILGFKADRKSFDMTSLANEVFKSSANLGARIYFIGGKPGVAEAASKILTSEFPGLIVLGAEPGYFSTQKERRTVISKIVQLHPDIVIVGMGAGEQERMLVDLKQAGFSGCGYTCGGFLHQTAFGNLHFYPRWIDKAGLRWAYRSFREPKVIRRLLVNYPISTFSLILDFVMAKCGQLNKD